MIGLLLLSCARLDPGARTCAGAASAEADALCEACTTEACRDDLGDRERVELRCGSDEVTASLVWALDHAGACVVRDPVDPPGCPLTDRIPFDPPGFDVEPGEDFATHLEREASIAIDPAGLTLPELADVVYLRVKTALTEDPAWLVPGMVTEATGLSPFEVYQVTHELIDPCCVETTMVDVYLDHERVLLDSGWGHRFRQRFGNPLDELAFEAAMHRGDVPDAGDLPVEMQFQAGQFVTADAAGVSRVRESTLWVSAGHPPFLAGDRFQPCLEEPEQCDTPLPGQPWRPVDWLPALQSGFVSVQGLDFVPLPSDALNGWFDEVGVESPTLEPVVVTVSTRRRFEVLLKFPGRLENPNPCPPDEPDCPDASQEESFLVSVDQTDVLAGVPWMEFVSGRTPPRRPTVLSTFREVEVELQSDTIDPLANLEADGDLVARDVLDALEVDHWHLIGLVTDTLRDLGANPVIADDSKYERAHADATLIRGDVDRSGATPDLADAVRLAALIDGPGVRAPAGDLDLDGDLTAADLQRLVEFLFLDGPEPPPPFPEPAIPCL